MCWSITKIQFCCQQKVHLQRKPTFLFYGIILCASPIFSAGCNNLMQPYHAVCKFCKSQFRSACPSHNNQFNAYIIYINIIKILLAEHTVLRNFYISVLHFQSILVAIRQNLMVLHELCTMSAAQTLIMHNKQEKSISRK